MAALDGPFTNRPARFATDDEWDAWTDQQNAIDVMPIMVADNTGDDNA